MRRTGWAAALAVVICVLATTFTPAGAGASQTVHLYASFTPDRPGASTTITFGFTVSSHNEPAPSPLLGVDLHLPAGIGLGHTTLGTAVCEPKGLYEQGPEGCPPNSRLGYGSALAEVPYGPEVVQEHATIDAYRGATVEEHAVILFFAEGWRPVFAHIIFPGLLLEGNGPFSGSIDTQVPLVPSLPGGPNVSVVQFQSTFGPKNLNYFRETNGELVPYKPRGVTVPALCPRSGYPFAGDFSFEDGTHQTVYATAPCPAAKATRRTRRR